MTDQPEKPKEDNKDELWRENQKNISNLTYKEIMDLNRQKNSKTFMDRTWRDRVEKEGSALDDPTLTRWQKFIQGRKFAEGLALKQRKVEFLEDLILKYKLFEIGTIDQHLFPFSIITIFAYNLIEKKEEFKEERDRLLIRMLEVKILNTFNMYRIPFMAGSFGFCLAFFLKSKMSLHVRLLPLMFLGSFASMYNYQVGQYGVYRNIDEIYKVMRGHPINIKMPKSHDQLKYINFN